MSPSSEQRQTARVCQMLGILVEVDNAVSTIEDGLNAVFEVCDEAV